MGKIARLPVELANQIAAGEVVERPASVIKELVENAIDAGAKRIAVSIELGGKRLIRVEDDGEGMDPDDARLALERHATSKISSVNDLGAIATLGFRGEALPAVASVSHFVLRTRRRGARSGTEIRVNGGAVAGVQEVGMAEGTQVEVADAFYNVPARRKFLKSDGAESAQVSRVVTQLALGYPEIGFSLTSAGRKLLAVPPVATMRERLYQLYGDRADLVPVHRETGGLLVTGYVAALADTGPTRGPQNVFVNRRIVKDRTISHAVIEAYSAASIKERSPELHLFLQIPHDWIDVNVHPTKAEVRFRDQGFVHEVVRRSVGDALGQGTVPAFALQAPESSGEDVARLRAQSIPNILAGGQFPSRWLPEGSDRLAGPSVAPDREGLADIAHPIQTEPNNAPNVRPMMALGQFRDTFIIAVDEEGIAIIDQHVAHERVLFERILEKLAGGRLESQRLLEPVLIELSPSGLQALIEHATDLDRLGFELEEFGPDSLRIRALPAILDRENSVTAIRALAEDLEGHDRGKVVADALRRLAATMACHAAVKANYPLTHQKMAHILDELRKTSYSTVCPHGRPVMLRLTRREVEKNFQRI
ncbi:MAG TPA: DNA mismatch repair endonuclease MutL [Vicinamibacterales bacterium]|jgi:DNA mismatch repair protein MutL